jgi:hypothetical protein
MVASEFVNVQTGLTQREIFLVILPTARRFHLLLPEVKTLRHLNVRETLSHKYREEMASSFQAVNKCNSYQG